MDQQLSSAAIAEGNKALRVQEAGRLLADLLGLEQPLSNQLVWRLVRKHHLPCVRLGRRMWFRSADLKAFVERGGTTS
jgi:excisionase family DNA binding protein